MTFLVTFVLTFSAAIVAAGYYIGNYLVGFGLMRGSADDPQAPPRGRHALRDARASTTGARLRWSPAKTTC